MFRPIISTHIGLNLSAFLNSRNFGTLIPMAKSSAGPRYVQVRFLKEDEDDEPPDPPPPAISPWMKNGWQTAMYLERGGLVESTIDIRCRWLSVNSYLGLGCFKTFLSYSFFFATK